MSFFARIADKNGGSVARGKTSFFCRIIFPVLLEKQNFCKHLLSNLFVINILLTIGNAEFTKRSLLPE